MTDTVQLSEHPKADEVYMIAGWRQWADAGSLSSGLPQYLIQQMKARKIGTIRPDGFYLFQIPGTHDLVRPVIKFNQGYPESLQTQTNELFYAGDERRGMVLFLGDEPHLDVDRYSSALLEAAKSLGVRRIIGLGGVYGELPYDKERMVSGTYSLPSLKAEMSSMAVNLSDYHGGVSIGSYICRRAGEAGMEYVAFYAFVPAYDLSSDVQASNTIRIENDFVAWLGVMRRINYMIKLDFDLTDLEEKSQHLIQIVNDKVDELESAAPQLGVRAYLKRLSDEFTETPFSPLEDVWEDEIRRLLDRLDSEET